MIKKAIFLIESPFDFQKYERFGIEFLQSKGFEVAVWDLTSVLYPERLKENFMPHPRQFEDIVRFNDQEEAYDKLCHLSSNDFVMNHIVYNYESLGVYRALSRSKSKYGSFFHDSVPISHEVVSDMRLKRLKDIFRFKQSNATWKKICLKLPFKCLGVKCADFVLIVGKRSIISRFPMDKSTKLLKAHSSDYDLYLRKKEESFEKQSIAVFIDENHPFARDVTRLKIDKTQMTADRYYPLVNKFFDLVEEKTGLKVVIAADPQSEYEKLGDYYKGRTRLRDKTMELIRSCQLVLGHSSTALSFANIFNKPVIFMTCRNLEKACDGGQIAEMAKWFGKRPVNMEHDPKEIDWEKELKVDKASYDRYRRNYIKAKDSEDLSLWEIVINKLRLEFCRF